MIIIQKTKNISKDHFLTIPKNKKLKIMKLCAIVHTIMKLLLLLICFSCSSSDKFISSDAFWGDGTFQNPWSLEQALSLEITPGQTLWLRGGMYSAPAGGYVSNLTGTKEEPIIIQSFHREWAVLVIDEKDETPQVLNILGNNTIYRDFGLVNINKERELSSYSERPRGFRLQGHHNKIINVISHDHGTNTCNDTSPEITGNEIYGSVMFNNGWDDALLNRGHSLYIKHNCEINCSPLIIRDNIIFQDFMGGIQIAGQVSKVNNIIVSGNVVFNSVTSSRLEHPRSQSQIHINSETFSIENIVVDNNLIRSTRPEDFFSEVGYFGFRIDNPSTGGQIIVSNNFIVGISTLSSPVNSLTIENNFFYGRVNHGLGPDPVPWDIMYDFDANGILNKVDDFQAFQNYYPNNIFDYQLPATNNKIFISKNEYDSDRFRIVVFNFEELNEVTIDLSEYLSVGDKFTIFNAQNIYAGVIKSGKINNNFIVSLPMTNLESFLPISIFSDHIQQIEKTGIRFNVFLLFRGNNFHRFSYVIN